MMAGVEDRVRDFLGSWAIVKQHLEQVTEEIEDGDESTDTDIS